MPITPYLRDQAFEPETLENMGTAFTQACQYLRLRGRDDRLTELVASCIVDLARRGVRTKDALYLMTVQEFTSKC